jgi:hypothetical protein
MWIKVGRSGELQYQTTKVVFLRNTNEAQITNWPTNIRNSSAIFVIRGSEGKNVYRRIQFEHGQQRTDGRTG